MKKNLIRKPLTAFLLTVTVLSAAVTPTTAQPAGTQTAGTQTAEAQELSTVTAVPAEYPAPTAEGLSAQDFLEGEEHWNWWSQIRESVMYSSDQQETIDGFYLACMEQLLPEKNSNTICSPLNIYLAFSMLAEITDGNTRQQILDMLGMPDMDTLRTDYALLWESNYADTPVLTSLPASSFWLNDSVTFNADTLGRLAQQYHASSFSGDPASEEMNQALRDWTDQNTGGLLSEYTENMQLDPATILALISAFYYKATWSEHFLPDNTSPEIFHGTDGDTTVDMMHLTVMVNVYRAYNFTALSLGLNDSGSMYFFLPRGNSDINSLAADPAVFNVLRNPGDEHWIYPLVHLTVPKFQISAKTDLMEFLRSLGITDVLDSSLSNFTPLTKQTGQVFLSSAEHAAMVEIDENGITGAAYTELFMVGAAMPQDEIDFVLDQPFLFIITGRDGSILFAGIVRNIE